MSLQPSFTCLYRRSRYSRSDEDQATGSRQHRRELFAVAAVAFVLKHHQDFRAHFIREICGYAESSEQTEVEVEVQPHNHTDLAIKVAKSSALFVVEFKVGADLESKQNPKYENEFFAIDGYGSLILQEPCYCLFNRKSYIVLDDFKEFEDGQRKGLDCKSRTWSDLIGGKAGSLWTDLLDSLGDLGVSAFQSQKLKNMHNAHHTKEAVAMHQTLSAVASKFKFGNSGGEDINFDGDEAWYGRNIPNKKLGAFLFLESRIQAKEGVLGWFGYQSGPGHFERAVWFYCGSEAAAKATHAFVVERIPTSTGQVVVKASDILIQSDDRLNLGDAEWFEAVFKALADRPTNIR